jgi:hypothetical protein
MAATPPIREFIVKYLDGAATNGDVAELARRLREDPDVADAFARACRLDAWLSKCFREEKHGGAFRAAFEKAERDSQQRRRMRRRFVWASAAAAALVCLALLLRPAARNGDGCAVLAGSVHDASGRVVEGIRPGPNYHAAADALLRVGDRAVFLVTARTEFTVRPTPAEPSLAMSVLSGALLAHVEPGQGSLTVTLDGVAARSSGGEFFGWCNASPPAAGGWGLLRQAFADASREVYLHAFAGDLHVDLCGQERVLAPGDSCLISNCLRMRSRSELEAMTRCLPPQCLGDAAGMRDRIRSLCSLYAQRLHELEGGKQPVACRAERIAVVKRLLEAHDRALEGLKSREADVLAREAAIAALARMRELEGEADAARRRLLELLSSAPWRRADP